MAVTPRTAHANHDFPSQYPCTCLSHARRCGWTIRRGQWTGAGGLGGQLQKWSAHSTCTRTAAWDACSHVSRRRDDHKIATTSSPWPRKRARFASHGARLLWRQAAAVRSDADDSIHFRLWWLRRRASAEPRARCASPKQATTRRARCPTHLPTTAHHCPPTAPRLPPSRRSELLVTRPDRRRVR